MNTNLEWNEQCPGELPAPNWKQPSALAWRGIRVAQCAPRARAFLCRYSLSLSLSLPLSRRTPFTSATATTFPSSFLENPAIIRLSFHSPYRLIGPHRCVPIAISLHYIPHSTNHPPNWDTTPHFVRLILPWYSLYHFIPWKKREKKVEGWCTLRRKVFKKFESTMFKQNNDDSKW